MQALIAQHLDALERIVKDSLKGNAAAFEGNAFYEHHTFKRHPALLHKQVQLFAMGGQIKNKCLEIGFNASHSMLLFLLGRRAVHGETPVDCYIFDINEHAYTMPCFEYLKSAFPEASFKFFKGDSTVELPAFIAGNGSVAGTFDLVHVDGGHFEHCIRSDFECAEKLVAKGGHIIVDDTNHPVINRVVDIALQVSSNYKEVAMYDSLPMYPHRILQRI